MRLFEHDPDLNIYAEIVKDKDPALYRKLSLLAADDLVALRSALEEELDETLYYLGKSVGSDTVKELIGRASRIENKGIIPFAARLIDAEVYSLIVAASVALSGILGGKLPPSDVISAVADQFHRMYTFPLGMIEAVLMEKEEGGDLK
ncbi:hypothetical protein DRJ17_05035 [Candidatus Woesearchaeota archaeon]|nr:MAG: hypothetical protein DRJ17_05035 [Candidatus Woesearchaeota archaeon]